MTDKWSQYGIVVSNQDETYQEFFNRTGERKIIHYGLVSFGDPISESFLSGLEVFQHVYKVGDSLSKIAHKHYGSPKYWWCLAWFNSKPTDFHCSIGDTIFIPKPLEKVISQAQNVSDL